MEVKIREERGSGRGTHACDALMPFFDQNGAILHTLISAPMSYC